MRLSRMDKKSTYPRNHLPNHTLSGSTLPKAGPVQTDSVRRELS